MKKSKLIIVSILAIAALSTATACAGKKNETPKTPVAASAETTAASTEKEETAAEQTEAGDEAKDAESKKSGQMTGVLEEIRDSSLLSFPMKTGNPMFFLWMTKEAGTV